MGEEEAELVADDEERSKGQDLFRKEVLFLQEAWMAHSLFHYSDPYCLSRI